MLALPAPYQVDLEKAAAALGVKEARLAEEKEFEDTFADCEVGRLSWLSLDRCPERCLH
jgi:Ala-tRNA(Pro) deacylase